MHEFEPETTPLCTILKTTSRRLKKVLKQNTDTYGMKNESKFVKFWDYKVFMLIGQHPALRLIIRLDNFKSGEFLGN